MTLSLDTLNADKIIEKVNRVTDIVEPQMYMGPLEFAIIGNDVKDAEQAKNALRSRLDFRLFINTMDSRDANNLSVVRGRTRAGVLMLDYVRLGTNAIQAFERSLYTACHLMAAANQPVEVDDLLMNMEGERFYKKR
jgi:hypothetical protein